MTAKKLFILSSDGGLLNLCFRRLKACVRQPMIHFHPVHLQDNSEMYLLMDECRWDYRKAVMFERDIVDLKIVKKNQASDVFVTPTMSSVKNIWTLILTPLAKKRITE